MEIRLSANFSKQYHRASDKIKKSFYKRLQLFKQDSRNPLLRNHPLKGSLQGFKSINVTGDWRALYSQFEEKDGIIIIFEMLGKHSQLYK
jgi:addiction module RelE/StbE family toxin